MQITKDLPFIAKTLFFSLLWSMLGGSISYAQLRSDLRLFSDSFLSPAYEASQKTNYQFVGMHLQTESFSQDQVRMNMQGAVAFDTPLMNYLNIRELYIHHQATDNDAIFVGRKLTTWSDLDQRWNLGLWQPLFQGNPLAPEQQGLSGLFWETQRSHYSVTVFASPLYIPNQGPSFEVRNGAFVDGNPWFRHPPDSMKIFSESTAVDYSLEKPAESDVVFRTSYGAKIEVGDEDGVLAQASYMYKPSNELALGYTGYLNTQTLKADVTVKPQVFFHSVLAADVSHKIESFRYGLSALVDRPQERIDLAEQWTKPEFKQAVLTSPFVEWSQPSYRLTVQGIHISGGEVVESGPRASTTRAPMTLRYPYQQALMGTFENRIPLPRGNKLSSKIAYTQSAKNKFELLQWQLRLKWTSTWTFFTDLAMIKAEDVSFENQNEIAQYRNLDRFLVGAAYVF